VVFIQNVRSIWCVSADLTLTTRLRHFRKIFRSVIGFHFSVIVSKVTIPPIRISSICYVKHKRLWSLDGCGSLALRIFAFILMFWYGLTKWLLVFFNTLCYYLSHYIRTKAVSPILSSFDSKPVAWWQKDQSWFSHWTQNYRLMEIGRLVCS
jgi:hypothetical protein